VGWRGVYLEGWRVHMEESKVDSTGQ